MIDGDAPVWRNATPDEQRILADIYETTGSAFPRVGGIRTDDPLIADKVLPILARWFSRMSDPGHRAGIVVEFAHPTGHSYLGRLLEWWQLEPDDDARGYITQVIAGLIECEDAEAVWTAYRQVPKDPFSVFILRRLANCRPTSQAARDEAVGMLRDGPPGYGPLEVISRINDPRIRRWFRDRIDDPDPEIRKLARRLMKRGKPLPLQVRRSGEGPDRFSELFSAEDNLRDLEVYFREVERRLSLKIPPWLRKAEFLDQVERDEWVWTEIRSKTGDAVIVWLRLEDLDVIEIVVTPAGPKQASQPPN